jgi:predicted nucleotidyltransferase
MTVLDDVIARVVRAAEPDRIVLFGSAAHGDVKPGSDLDLLVIKRGVVHRRHLAQTIYRALVGVGIPVDVVVVTPEDIGAYKDGVATIIGPALRDGREVYAA